MLDNKFDVIIVGAGAAGLYAAGIAVNNGAKVLLLEKMPSAGRKLLITGKGRCNITNNCSVDDFIPKVKRGKKFLYSALYGLPPQQLIEWFNRLGLDTKTERGGRVFPVSDRSHDVLKTLMKASQQAQLRLECEVKKIITEYSTSNDKATAVGVRLADGRDFFAKSVVVATGGLSYPGTGSTGDGYKMLKELGHSVEPCRPSLVALRSPDKCCAELMGLSLKNVSASLFVNDKSCFKEQGEMLFTHFGLSGPLILSASCELPQKFRSAYISIDFKPALDEKKLSDRIDGDITLLRAKTAARSLDALLPKRLIPIMLNRWGIDPTKQANRITREERRDLVGLLKDFRVEINGTDGLSHAVITEGGIKLTEVSPTDMQSKLINNLYIIGEVLDLSAVTGGYNLHIAFSTANAAATSITEKNE